MNINTMSADDVKHDRARCPQCTNKVFWEYDMQNGYPSHIKCNYCGAMYDKQGKVYTPITAVNLLKQSTSVEDWNERREIIKDWGMSLNEIDTSGLITEVLGLSADEVKAIDAAKLKNGSISRR